MWHPRAWEFARSRVDFPITNSHLLQFKNGRIIRGKSTLLSFSDLEIGLGEWITITGKLVVVKQPCLNQLCN